MKKNILTIILTILFAAVAFGQAKLTSIYTDLTTEKCKTVEENPDEGGSYVGECAGAGGYKLELTEGDLRQSINVIAPGKKKSELNVNQFFGGFSGIGAKAEWRMSGKTPVALIFRFNVSENPEDSSKTTSYLIVTKITKNETCVTDVVKPGKTQNAEAQKFADAAAKKPCKTSE